MIRLYSYASLRANKNEVGRLALTAVPLYRAPFARFVFGSKDSSQDSTTFQ